MSFMITFDVRPMWRWLVSAALSRPSAKRECETRALLATTVQRRVSRPTAGVRWPWSFLRNWWCIANGGKIDVIHNRAVKRKFLQDPFDCPQKRELRRKRRAGCWRRL